MKSLRIFFMLLAPAVLCCSCSGHKGEIKNDIAVNENGLHIQAAFLENARGEKLGDENKVQVGDRIYLRLMIAGFQQKNGRVYFDASQKTATASGEVLASNPSMFGQVYTAGVPVKDAGLISLYQKMGKLQNPREPIVISFKVWDKLTNHSVSGSYQLHLH